MTLSAALNDAHRRGLPVSQALHSVSAPRRSDRQIETLTREEASRLIVAARDDPMEAVYVLAVTLGLREGELLGLSWRNVDLERRTLTVTGNATRTIAGEHVVTPPKTHAGSRTLTLPRIAVDALSRTARVGDLVWPNGDGRPLPATTFTKRWNAMRTRAGVRAVNFHALRHTAATLLLQNRRPAQEVAYMLGHASVSTTLRLYAHVTPAGLDALADAIDAQFGAPLRVVREETRETLRNPKRHKRKRVPGKGIEPLRPYEHSALNAACLPVPPSRRGTRWYQRRPRATGARR